MAVAKTVWGFIENRDHRVMRRMNSWTRAAVDPVLDAERHAHGRRLALV